MGDFSKTTYAQRFLISGHSLNNLSILYNHDIYYISEGSLTVVCAQCVLALKGTPWSGVTETFKNFVNDNSKMQAIQGCRVSEEI